MTASAFRSRSETMPPKLDATSETDRVHIVAPRALLQEVEEWRAQHRPIPSLSHAIRRLIELGLEAERLRGKKSADAV